MQITKRSLLLTRLAVLLASPTTDDDAEDIRLSAPRIGPNNVTLTWSGGRPTFQLQRRATIDEQWINVGTSTVEHTASIPLDETQAFFRVISDSTARYEVVFEATWSQATHPQDWPNPGHWSGLVGAVHNREVSFFEEGESATEGIRLMAERGQQDPLLREVASAVQEGTAQFPLRGGGISVSPGATRLAFPEPLRRDYPLVTLCSMVAPSPDWFVGVSGLSLLVNDEWTNELRVPLFPYDAGTDNGRTFVSPDEVTTPRGVIEPLTQPPIGLNGAVVPFGTFTFRRLD